MKQTINIDEDIWEKAQIEAKKREISTDDIIEQALETYLSIDTKKLSLNSEECCYKLYLFGKKIEVAKIWTNKLKDNCKG